MAVDLRQVSHLFVCEKPPDAVATGEVEKGPDGQTFAIWRTECHEYLRVERENAEFWFRMEAQK